MNASRFDRSVERSLGSQLHRLTRGVPRRKRDEALRDVWLVLQGDYGGQIYLTVPLVCIPRRTMPRIGQLLREMDTLAWGCNGLDGASVRLVRPRTIAELERDCLLDEFTREEVATAYGFESWDAFVAENRMFVSGGMGGGSLFNRAVWLHEEFLGKPVSQAQDLVDELRGANCEEVRAMDWPSRVKQLLDLQQEPS